MLNLPFWEITNVFPSQLKPVIAHFSVSSSSPPPRGGVGWGGAGDVLIELVPVDDIRKIK